MIATYTDLFSFKREFIGCKAFSTHYYSFLDIDADFRLYLAFHSQQQSFVAALVEHEYSIEYVPRGQLREEDR